MPTLIKLYIELYVWIFRLFFKYLLPLFAVGAVIALIAGVVSGATTE